MKNKILVTGSAGYIGSTFVNEALKRNYTVVGIDNYSNSNSDITDYFSESYPENFSFHNLDIRDSSTIKKMINMEQEINTLIHFAALKSVEESTKKPDLYWNNNVLGTIKLLEAIKNSGIKNIIFSSSASVYGDQEKQPVNEALNPKPTSKYAETKLECEEVVKNFCMGKETKAISLRYFNPVASHSDFLIYEDYNNSNNLMSIILQAAKKTISTIKIFGNDYATRDGTGERDFIHIQDLIDGHFAALEKINSIKNYHVINLGTGKGATVFEVIHTFEKVNNTKFEIEIAKRRCGDIEKNFADVSKAKQVLNWQSRYNLEKMCKDAWEAIQE